MNKMQLINKYHRNPNNIIYSVVRKIGTDKILEVQEINTLTKEKKTVFQDKDYKKLRKD